MFAGAKGGFAGLAQTARMATQLVATLKGLLAGVAGVLGYAIGNLINKYDIMDLITGTYTFSEYWNRKVEDIKVLMNSYEMKMKILNEFLPVLKNTVAGSCSMNGFLGIGKVSFPDSVIAVRVSCTTRDYSF